LNENKKKAYGTAFDEGLRVLGLIVINSESPILVKMTSACTLQTFVDAVLEVYSLQLVNCLWNIRKCQLKILALAKNCQETLSHLSKN